MVERIDKEEGKLLAKIEIERAVDELNAAKALHENGFYFAASGNLVDRNCSFFYFY